MAIPNPVLASNGRAGRIIGPKGSGVSVHIDAITSISRSSKYNRTTTALEKGAPLTIHRQRVPETVTMQIAVSDVEPYPGARFAALWERNHSAKTRQRIKDAQAFDAELQVWTGQEFLRTPAGSEVWVLDDFAEQIDGSQEDNLMGTLTFGESPRFTTAFTPFSVVSDELTDVAGDSADRGRQSTTSTDTLTQVWP